MKVPRERISDRGHKPERQISDEHLGEFNPEGSRGMEFIESLCPSVSLTRESLIVLAQVFSVLSSVPFHRDFTRRRILVIKWFNDNVDQLEPFASLFTLETESLQPKDEDSDSFLNNSDQTSTENS
jgi:hypothetical protein